MLWEPCLLQTSYAMEKLSQPSPRATATVNYLGSFSPPPGVNQPCASLVQHGGIKEKNEPPVAVFVKRGGFRQAAVLSGGHNLSRLWGRLRGIAFQRLTYICWQAAHRRLLTTAVPPREKACKRRRAGERKPLRIPLPVPGRQTAPQLCQEQDCQLT